MAQRIEINHGPITAEIEYGIADLQALSPERFGGLFRYLLAVHLVVPLQSFTFKASTAPATGYRYEFLAADGRVFNQVLWFDVPSDPQQTFSTGTSRWRVTEFSLQRPIREQIVLLYGAIGLEKVEVVFA